jgi:hypothetical protein
MFRRRRNKRAAGDQPLEDDQPAETVQRPKGGVWLRLSQNFNDVSQPGAPGYLSPSDFLNAVADKIRELDPEAFPPGSWSSIASEGDPSISLKGDQKKIEDALVKIFGRASDPGTAYVGRTIYDPETEFDDRDMVLHIYDTRSNLAKEKKLPVPAK